jgi:REP element-mobilizing transposase RayT
MARPLRIEYPGALYHVISRGNARGMIVRDDADRRKRLDWLRRTVETYGWQLHAFALMGNHEHLFLQTPDANLAAGMQYLNGSYTGYFNRRHRRSGHLFQGRYRGHLVEEEGYFLKVSRYIHLNPVRAGLAARPEAWPWSSYAGYRRASRTLPWVTYRSVLGEFALSESVARRAYVRFVRAAMDGEAGSPFASAAGGLLVGSAAFVARINALLEERPVDSSLPQLEQLRPRVAIERIAAVVAAHFEVDPRDWTPGTRSDDAGRAVAAYLARRRFGHSAGAVAAALGYRSHGSVRNALRRVESAGDDLLGLVDKLYRELASD